jgi:hypothetical protein
MFRRYAHDLGMQSKDTADRALENDVVHGKLLSGSVVIACTANVQATSTVVFPLPFSSSTDPDIMVCLTAIGNAASMIKYLVGASASSTGFTIQVLSDTTQSITVTYYAKGITS